MGERGAELGFSSISYAVMIDELVAAILGPQLVIWTRDSIPDLAFAGSFIGQVALALLAIPVLLLLRPPPTKRPFEEISRCRSTT